MSSSSSPKYPTVPLHSTWHIAGTQYLFPEYTEKQPTNTFRILSLLWFDSASHKQTASRHRLPPLASLNIWSSSRRRLCSTCRRPLSWASRIRRCRSASMAKAWILLSSCSLTSSLDRKSNISASTLPSSPAKWFSTSNTLEVIIQF